MFVGVSILSCASFAIADVVELKTGQRVEGTLKKLSLSSASIEVGGQLITFESGKIRAIYFGAAPGPAPSTARPSHAQDALRALKDLQSATSANVTYRDYGPRVTDTKIRVDRYLRSPEQGDANVREALKLALGSYVAIASLWGNILFGPIGVERRKILDHTLAVFASCKTQEPDIQTKIIEFSVAGTSALLPGSRTALPAMFECASERVNELKDQ